jgi:hypothetical protein
VTRGLDQSGNRDRLLRLLEMNVAQATESALIRRLRNALHALQDSRGTTTCHAKEADAGHGADLHVHSNGREKGPTNVG